MSQPAKLTQARLKELLDYNERSGDFTWKIRRRRVPAGAKAGGICSNGYVRLRVDGVRYRAHRLAWLWVYGVMPGEQVDHINGDTTDNRLSNLREATAFENHQNLGVYKSNSSGFPGVSQEPSGKWRARIRADNKRHCLGTFNSRDSAVEAYLAAKAELHKFSPSVRSGVGHG